MNKRPFDPTAFNRANYKRVWLELNRALRIVEADGGLGTAFEVLERQQINVGFIQDDLTLVERYRLVPPPGSSHAFTAQFNPRRSLRHAGAGRVSPPNGSTAVNGGCFLCRHNVHWQQRGVEVGYDLRTRNHEYVAWMNPFPLMPSHVTIARRDHVPQTWVRQTPSASALAIRQTLDDLLELASRLPRFVGFYNGEGAGATIPRHFHFQFFRRAEGQVFALEKAAALAAANVLGQRPLVIRNYPIMAIYFVGKREEIASRASHWVGYWTSYYESGCALSANMISYRDSKDKDMFHLFFVPRNRFYSRAPGIAGLVGGLEVLGELVLSTPDEKTLLTSGQIDYASIVRVLASVEAPDVAEFLNTIPS